MPFGTSNNECRSQTILLVDDHTNYRMVARTVLGKFLPKYSILDADSIATALRIIEDKKPDVVVVDLTLTDGTALDLVEQSSGYFKQSGRIIVISSHTREELRPLLNCSNVHGYISKDEGVMALAKMVEEVSHF